MLRFKINNSRLPDSRIVGLYIASLANDIIDCILLVIRAIPLALLLIILLPFALVDLLTGYHA